MTDGKKEGDLRAQIGIATVVKASAPCTVSDIRASTQPLLLVSRSPTAAFTVDG